MFIAVAFTTGTATGMVIWMVLQGDDRQAMSSTDDEDPFAVWIDTLMADTQSGTSVQDLADAVDIGAGSTVELPDAELSVASDGCGVIRSDLEIEPHGLQWTILDNEGFQTLGRNALGETRYRYFAPGTYTVVLEAWDGEKYAPISNTVTIDC